MADHINSAFVVYLFGVFVIFHRKTFILQPAFGYLWHANESFQLFSENSTSWSKQLYVNKHPLLVSY